MLHLAPPFKKDWVKRFFCSCTWGFLFSNKCGFLHKKDNRTKQAIQAKDLAKFSDKLWILTFALARIFTSVFCPARIQCPKTGRWHLSGAQPLWSKLSATNQRYYLTKRRWPTPEEIINQINDVGNVYQIVCIHIASFLGNRRGSHLKQVID